MSHAPLKIVAIMNISTTFAMFLSVFSVIKKEQQLTYRWRGILINHLLLDMFSTFDHYDDNIQFYYAYQSE